MDTWILLRYGSTWLYWIAINLLLWACHKKAPQPQEEQITIKQIERLISSVPPAYEKAIPAAEHLIRKSKSKGDYLTACHALLLRGCTYNLMGEVTKAYHDYDLLEQWMTNYDIIKPSWQFTVFNNRGLIHRNLQQYESAIPFFLQAIELKGIADNRKANATYNLGLVYRAMGNENIPFALEWFDRSKDHSEKAEYYSNMADIMEQHARIFMMEEQYDSARWAYAEALHYAEAHDLSSSLGKIYHNQGVFLHQQGKHHEAQVSYEAALTYRTRPSKSALTHIFYGNLLMDMGHSAVALVHWEQAMQLGFDELDHDQVKVYLRLAAHHWQQGEKAVGDQYGNRYEAAMDRLHQSFSEVKLAHLQMAFNSQLAQRQQEEEAARLRKLILWIIGGSIFAALLVYMLYRKRKAKRNRDISNTIQTMMVR